MSWLKPLGLGLDDLLLDLLLLLLDGLLLDELA